MSISYFILGCWLLNEVSAYQDRSCKPTSADILGPYYYPNVPRRRQICERDRAFHQQRHLLVEGRVMDETCRPLSGARIEVWQADADGHYLFKDMCRGHFYTQIRGNYAFLTLRPGKYSTDPTGRLFRPAHIHFRVVAPDHDILVTQMYFDGDSSLGVNDSCSTCSSDHPDLVVSTHEMCADESGKYCIDIAHFDLVLRRGSGVDVVKDVDDSLPELLDMAKEGK
ncbi:hypothetical protein DPMN_177100 [Dreissena polymorpha]|uniref:Intradiol ring-cleavage dioxygenases domain-containing protein n=2 Tax=Dreissena polymorpha TaxID=45954 RepID=A0A9D4ECC4_DREPO|nr:hypothetical protein DPMN_177100 [Dreissena polymorpha]